MIVQTDAVRAASIERMEREKCETRERETAERTAASPDDRIMVVPAAVWATLYDLLHTEIGRLRCKARETRFVWKRWALEARADGLRALADEVAR